nr:GTP-binding protein [Bradyrhizobium erythrophlei]
MDFRCDPAPGTRYSAHQGCSGHARRRRPVCHSGGAYADGGGHQRPWKDTEQRQSRLVFIGRNLPKDVLREGFEACRA